MSSSGARPAVRPAPPSGAAHGLQRRPVVGDEDLVPALRGPRHRRGRHGGVLWTILDGMGVFDQINGIVGQVVQDGSQRFDILDFVGFGRVVSLSIVIGVIDVILITAIATLAAFLYNVSSALVGGMQLTLTDD